MGSYFQYTTARTNQKPVATATATITTITTTKTTETAAKTSG